eukprot:gene10717-12466_t
MACYVQSCLFDGGDCRGAGVNKQECAKGCPINMVGDKWCMAKCNVKECNFDGGDCESQNTGNQGTTCDPGCQDSMLGNGYCDYECNTFNCQYDHGDCGSMAEHGTNSTLTSSGGATPALDSIPSTPQCQVMPPDLSFCEMPNGTSIMSTRGCLEADSTLKSKHVLTNMDNVLEAECFNTQAYFMCSRGCVLCAQGKAQPVCRNVCHDFKYKCANVKGVDVSRLDCNSDQYSDLLTCTKVASVSNPSNTGNSQFQHIFSAKSMLIALFIMALLS